MLKVGNQEVADEISWRHTCNQARTLGFDSILAAPFWRASQSGGEAPFDPDYFAFDECGRETMAHAVARLAAICAEEGVSLLMDVVLDQTAVGGALAQAYPEWFAPPSSSLDPRAVAMEVLHARKSEGKVDAGLLDDWAHRLGQWARAGAGGFRCRSVSGLAGADWRRVIDAVRGEQEGCRFLAWTPGMTAEQVFELRGAGFDATFLSLPWWDFRAAWLAEEHERLRAVAPVIVPISEDGPACLQADAGQQGAWQRCIWTAAISGVAVMVSDRMIHAGAAAELQKMNEWLGGRFVADAPLRLLTGPLSETTVLFRDGAGIMLNPSADRPAIMDWGLVRARLPEDYGDVQLPSGLKDGLVPAGCARFLARRTSPVRLAVARVAEKRKLGLGGMHGARIAIENVEPSLDGGRFAAKATVGQAVAVEADVFMDGHDRLAVVLLWRAADEAGWHEQPMVHMGNDRWRASFTPLRLGRHLFMVKAWLDTWESYRVGLAKKLEAGTNISVDLQEGRLMLCEALQRAERENKKLAETLRDILDSDEIDVNAITSDATARIMRGMDARPFETPEDSGYTLMVERREACYASWYELFPRSQSNVSGVHGTFQDVRRRLPAIRDMGFDVLYFPPIHPIGTANRKGRNNALAAGPADPGSPYAIGSEHGGHDAIHPELGTLDDFRVLMDDARAHGLEIALDFAIQCSPDHPWLTEHRKWFSWRADGSLRYAENPPKRYEDIVNPDFYQGTVQPKPQASLWRELRDVVLYWIDQGVRIFRVDNPHTKPLPFWEWLLGEVHASHPDVIFLSEAFTRPRMMYRLAKLGFSQSYTYFTWRNDKQELTAYLEELVSPPAVYSFRPNFFVNTPDINPFFLQSSGRAGFLIRAALASMLSGAWGVYSGFELCEARALPGREEYADSEKYELRAWDWERPGNIIAEIAQLNRIRRSNPALQTHLGLQFHTVHDDNVLFFSKSTLQEDNIVLVVVSLDPRNMHRPWLELPLWKWSLPDDGRLLLKDLCSGTIFEIQGKSHEVELTPERPYAIWQMLGLG